MKDPKGNGLRWLEQAGHDFELAQKELRVLKFYSDACFMAEQASQKALKAFLLFKGERYVFIHSVAELAKFASRYDKGFIKLVKLGAKLDQYYIPTRYPDALNAPAVPYRSYDKDDAKDAVKCSQKILKLVKKKLSI